jgi:hypothetical protein
MDRRELDHQAVEAAHIDARREDARRIVDREAVGTLEEKMRAGRVAAA